MKQLLLFIFALYIAIISECCGNKNQSRSEIDTAETPESVQTTKATEETEATEEYVYEGGDVYERDTYIADTPVPLETVNETAPISQQSQPEAPQQYEPEPVEPEPEQPSETIAESEPKQSIQKANIENICKECIRSAQNMGYTLNESLTPNNASWWNPISVSVSDQEENIIRILSGYIEFHTPDNLSMYGFDRITCFNIYIEKESEEIYRFYFLFA